MAHTRNTGVHTIVRVCSHSRTYPAYHACNGYCCKPVAVEQSSPQPWQRMMIFNIQLQHSFLCQVSWCVTNDKRSMARRGPRVTYAACAGGRGIRVLLHREASELGCRETPRRQALLCFYCRHLAKLRYCSRNQWSSNIHMCLPVTAVLEGELWRCHQPVDTCNLHRSIHHSTMHEGCTQRLL